MIRGQGPTKIKPSHRRLDRGLHSRHHAAEHFRHQGGGQGQLRAGGVPAAGHRVLRGAVHRQRGVDFRRRRPGQHPALFNGTSSLVTISAGAAIAAYSFLGFDAVTTLTEETVNPRKNMPRAIMLIALFGGGIFVAVSYVTQLVHAGGVFEDSASAASAIALQIGGQLFGAVFLAGLVVARFASGLAAQASASRLLYAMGRDSVLPKAVFGRLSEKFHTPVANLMITGVVSLVPVFLDVATSTSFINFGAFTA